MPTVLCRLYVHRDVNTKCQHRDEIAARTSWESKQQHDAAAFTTDTDFHDELEGARLLQCRQKAVLDAWLARLRGKHADGQHAGKKRRKSGHE